MSDYFAKKDSHDKNGILLISKDKKIMDAINAQQKNLISYNPEELINFDKKQRAVLTPITKTFGARMNISDDRVLEQPKKILSTIIFQSKNKPWWIYVNAMSNYVDWLYIHSIDVAIISLMMAVELGYRDEELLNIGLGAFMHDVGKLLVPKFIIQKPGPLTDTEMVYIRQHCELGMSTLEPFNLPRECTDIVLQHHERLDGSGYPKGLKGDEICRNARIVMIADAFDAITSGRPYKKLQEMDSAIKILKYDQEKYPQELVALLEKILN